MCPLGPLAPSVRIEKRNLTYSHQPRTCDAQIVPEAIRNYVKTNYPDARILQIEYDDNEYEIKLSNRWEITFDSKMRVIDIDD